MRRPASRAGTSARRTRLAAGRERMWRFGSQHRDDAGRGTPAARSWRACAAEPVDQEAAHRAMAGLDRRHPTDRVGLPNWKANHQLPAAQRDGRRPLAPSRPQAGGDRRGSRAGNHERFETVAGRRRSFGARGWLLPHRCREHASRNHGRCRRARSAACCPVLAATVRDGGGGRRLLAGRHHGWPSPRSREPNRRPEVSRRDGYPGCAPADAVRHGRRHADHLDVPRKLRTVETEERKQTMRTWRNMATIIPSPASR